MAGDVGDLALSIPAAAAAVAYPARKECPDRPSCGNPAARARRLMIKATDWSESRSFVAVSPRRIRRKTGPR